MEKKPIAVQPHLIGLLRIKAMILFRDESLMLKFAGTIQVDRGSLQTEYHYDPQVAIVLSGLASPLDVSRLLSHAADFPGITHASAEVETVKNQ